MRRFIAGAAIAALVMPGPVAQASGSETAGGSDALSLVTMERITAPIVERGRLQGQLQIRLVLNAIDGAAGARATHELPRVRAAAVAATLDFARLHASTLTAVDAGQLSQDLTAAIRAVSPEISRVLIVEVAAMAA